MNNILVKTTFQALILLSLVLPYQIKTIQMPWYQDYFHKLNGIRYAQHCSLIHTAQKIRGGALLTYYRATHKKINLNKAINLVNNQLKEFETWLIALEQDTLIAIKEKYHMSDEIWQRYLTDTQKVKDSYRNGMLHSHPDITHDQAVPGDILKILTILLNANNINPHTVHIKMVSDQTLINENPNTLVQVRSFIEPIVTGKSKNSLTILSSYIPASIEIFPELNNRSLSEKISFCAHEIQHLIQQHSITELILRQYLDHYYGIDDATIDQSAEYHILSQIYEAQAEILSAIKNSKIARCHTMMRKKYLYPNHLYEEHFIHLSTIDMLWKINARLKFFEQKWLINKKNEWFAKITKYGNSLKELLI